MTAVLEPYQWMALAMMGFCCMCVNVYLLKTECRHSKKPTITSTKPYIQIWSTPCFIYGIIFGLLYFIGYFQILCKISSELINISFTGQAISMGFYQISRLHYCFAQATVYNQHGYPQYIFIIMYIIGGIMLVSSLIYPWIFSDVHIKCGINEHCQYYPFESMFKANEVNSGWVYIGSTTFILWDVTTLLLYSCKILNINRQKCFAKQIQKRIMSILNRIMILTLFYEIGFILSFITLVIHSFSDNNNSYTLNVISLLMTSVMISYSIFLMQSQNTDQYRKFLEILYKSRLYYIFGCCCCEKMITNDLYSSNSMNSPTDDQQNAEKKPQSEMTTTAFEDPSIEIIPKASIESTLTMQ